MDHGISGVAAVHTQDFEPIDAKPRFGVTARCFFTRNLIQNLIYERNVRTVIGVSSGSSTRDAAVKMPIAGPI